MNEIRKKCCASNDVSKTLTRLMYTNTYTDLLLDEFCPNYRLFFIRCNRSVEKQDPHLQKL